jgi:uncharacterized membrane protein YbhN (UPF0104 family)
MIIHKIIYKRDYITEFTFKFLSAFIICAICLFLPVLFTFAFYYNSEMNFNLTYYYFIYFEVLISWCYSVYIISKQDFKIEYKKVEHIIREGKNDKNKTRRIN